MTLHNIYETIETYEKEHNESFVYPALTQSNPALEFEQKNPKFVFNEDNQILKNNYQNYVERAYESSMKDKKGNFVNGWNTAEFEGFNLPAQGEFSMYCKKWISKGCNNIKSHPENKHYAQHEIKTCKRSNCPKCFESWINRQANRSARRFIAFAGKRKYNFRHIIMSPPQELAKRLSYSELKMWLKVAMREANIKTCAVIFHPFRFQDHKKKMPYISPHWHLIAYGRITNTNVFTDRMLKIDGERVHGHKWLIKNKGDLKSDISVFNCTRYLLSHAGVKKGTHAVRYMGDISYRKLKLEKQENMNKCPHCNLPLMIFHIVNSPMCEPPPIDHVGLWEADCFKPVNPLYNDGKIPFYELNLDSDNEYSEQLIYSYEELLSVKTNQPKIDEYHKRIQDQIDNPRYLTSLDCQKISNF